ncbi:MAG: hypothetical protein MUF34_16350 [Polyangiaceae bacterium]|nr:hypothetical protein [Polyangiaceae bacterium]
MNPTRTLTALALGAALLAAGFENEALAQVPNFPPLPIPIPGWGTPQAAPPGAPPQGMPPGGGYGYGGGTGYGYAPPVEDASSSDLEVGSLYVMSAIYGVGTGIWIDAEAKIKDPGLQFIAPGLLGIAGPVGVYFLDNPRMPRGVPAAISSGIAIGAGEGVAIWTLQYTRSSRANEWGFRELTRATFLGATAGGLAGGVAGFLQEPSPKTSLLLDSSAIWGGIVGSMIGYGATAPNQTYSEANGGAGLGGIIGYNLGLAAAAGLSTVWVPTYTNLAWMWLGAGAGFVATLPVYLFYIGSDSDSSAKRGLIVQGLGVTAGTVAGAVFTLDDRDDYAKNAPKPGPGTAIGRIGGIGPMAVPGGGMGLQLTGILF